MFTKAKFKNKKACVLGMGKSGVAAARLLKRQGFKVLLSEEQPKPLPAGLEGIDTETGGHSAKIFDCDFFVKSPGISHGHAVIKKIKKLKKPLFSEIEIALAFAPRDIKLFAITGTNGKTTTTQLLSEILNAHCARGKEKRKVYTVGNIGTPLAAIADKMAPGSFVVTEVSSYQLEDSSYLRPRVAAILNITPDHLEHHGGMAKYGAAKARIFADQKNTDALIINGGDKNCVKFIKQAKSRVLSFSAAAAHAVKVDVFYDGDEIIFSGGQRLKPPKLLLGLHNIENAMAAALMAFAAGVSAASVQAGFDVFSCPEHRIEYFAQRKGVKCYNDSKATNVDSTLIALKALQSQNKIWIILGGRDKGAPYQPLIPYLNRYGKHAVLIGEAAPLIKKELAGRFPATEKGDIKNAVDFIFAGAAPGDIMLLSPACASFDQFTGFEERGRFFKQIVRDYIKAHK
ncbi:MAG: UDP-N-acetylmuramoyl-L-alanine--D-glutamate ligase [Elusimicrobiota bacterium]|jgi:UDP-N-acetylmuramoylalanine--D-glutamate ligase|nr:UDP-N-acetylmuramoyl-L-alanine--D-glutamate ligase [Elusimicrobiota bacterium]